MSLKNWDWNFIELTNSFLFLKNGNVFELEISVGGPPYAKHAE